MRGSPLMVASTPSAARASPGSMVSALRATRATNGSPLTCIAR